MAAFDLEFVDHFGSYQVSLELPLAEHLLALGALVVIEAPVGDTGITEGVATNEALGLFEDLVADGAEQML